MGPRKGFSENIGVEVRIVLLDVKVVSHLCFYYPLSFKEYRYRVNKHVVFQVIQPFN